MGLHLHYIDSVAPYLSEIIENLVLKHFDFKLKDTFRIITPNNLTALEIEDRLLQEEAAEKILIGKSIQGFSSFWQSLLRELPQPRILANVPLERKALHLTLKEKGHPLALQGNRLNQALRELKRHYLLKRIQNPKNPKPTIHAWWSDYQNLIGEDWKVWTLEQAFAVLSQRIREGKINTLQPVQEIFFLGFLYPTPDLVHFVSALCEGYPDIRLYAFFPPPKTLLGRDGFLEPMLNFLESILDSKTLHTKIQKPKPSIEYHPTPLHEAQYLFQKMQDGKSCSGIFFPGSSTTEIYYSRLLGEGFPSELSRLGPIETPTYLAEWLRKRFCDFNENETIPLSKFYDEIFPFFEELRHSLSRQETLLGLKDLENWHDALLEQIQLENLQPENLSRTEWIDILEDELETKKIRIQPGTHESGVPRVISSPGIRCWTDVYAGSLNEGLFPQLLPFPLFQEWPEDPWLHQETKLQLEQLNYLAKGKMILSWSSFDMTGRVQAPSPLLSEIIEEESHKAISLKNFLGTQSHPYLQENVSREYKRQFSTIENPDMGDLEKLSLEKSIFQEVKKRPLSPSYIEDYAKCPWRFFARWFLGVDTLIEKDLEMEPRLRGSFLHHLMEKTYRRLNKEGMDQGKLPSDQQWQMVLNDEFTKLLEESLQNEKSNLFPQEVLLDELGKIKIQASRVLEKEISQWREAKNSLLPYEFEWKYKIDLKISDQQSIPLTGVIDRIDFNLDKKDFLVVDYKSSGADRFSREIRNLSNFQLYLYVIAVEKLLFPRARSLGGLYWDFKKASFNQGMVWKEPYQIYANSSGRSKSFYSEENYLEIQKKLRETLIGILKEILKGNYRLDPPDCQGDRCPYHEICRYPRQPQ